MYLPDGTETGLELLLNKGDIEAFPLLLAGSCPPIALTISLTETDANSDKSLVKVKSQISTHKKNSTKNNLKLKNLPFLF